MAGMAIGNTVRVALLAFMAMLAAPARADIIQAIERVKPSVVMVGVYRATGSPRFLLRGTGFVVGDGSLVATNAHVMAAVLQDAGGSLAIQAGGGMPDQRLRKARSLVVDEEHDLVLLKIDGSSLPALPLADSGMVREGLSVAFTGFPIGGLLGFSPVTHRGMVSAITPIVLPGANAAELRASVIQRLKNGNFDVFQLDGTAYPGNSGGPLFDIDSGQVVGIINMVLVKATKEAALSQPSGITYAIPGNHLRRLLERAALP
jgi:S1-C subfamily serine protease